MTQLLTAAEMRAVEAAVIESGEVSGLELMERAGRGVIEAIFQTWPALQGRGASPSDTPGYFGQDEKAPRAVVLCGPGNNGGDGFVVARLLQGMGWAVEVYLYGDGEKLPPDAKVNYRRWTGPTHALPCQGGAVDWTGCALIVDALFGTGLSRGLDPAAGLAELLPDWQMRFDQGRPRIVAVDIVSGLCSDSGKVLGEQHLWADLTVTFHTAKPGHYLGCGAVFSAAVVVADIGLPDAGCAAGLTLVSAGNSVAAARRGNRAWSKEAHKYSHGHALVLSGGAGKTGAARLAARAALRIGAGVVTLGVPPSAQLEVAAHVTAVMLGRLPDPQALAQMLQDARLNALCLGPGLGHQRARDLVPVALRAQHGPKTVLDADALSAFQDAPAELFAMLHGDTVLTPHEGEFRRLFPDIHSRLRQAGARGPAYSKVDATRAAAARAGCTVLFKGADTVIARQDGACALHSAQYDRAAPWLATAGSGDVLAGFITGLLAQGQEPFEAAQMAAWLHVECARQFGPGLIAEDLPEQLPAVFRQLLDENA